MPISLDLNINVNKIMRTKVMIFFKWSIYMYQYICGWTKKMNKFRYIGVWIAEDERSETEIRTRLGMAKETLRIWKQRN